MHAFIVSVLLYMFPPQTVAKLIVVLFKKLASSTEWTKVDDDLVAVIEKKVSPVNDDVGQDQ